MGKLTILALLTGSHRARDAARDPGRRDVIWYERPDHIRLADADGWCQRVHRQSRRLGRASSTARYPAEGFGLPIWSPDRSRLLISHVLRFDASGNLLPFRPATVNPDGSGFKLLQPPNVPDDGGCFGGRYPDGSRLLCGFGGGQPGVFSIRAGSGNAALAAARVGGPAAYGQFLRCYPGGSS
jgi:hypothetical protein